MMDIVKTSLGISKTIRNAGRLREIALVFARYGFGDLIGKSVVPKFPDLVLPRSSKNITIEVKGKAPKDWGQIIGQSLKLSFEELGPAFIKFGQLLASRDDLLPPSFIFELAKLKDSVKPIPFVEVKKIINDSLGESFTKSFASIDESPIGTASIGGVYRGVLKNGDQVVIKVRKPNIEKDIETDFSILLFLVSQMEKVSEEIKYLGLTRIINDFSSTLEGELNFYFEAFNCKRLKTNLAKHDLENLIYVPKIYDEFTSENVLVMEFLDGEAFTKYKDNGDCPEVKEKLEQSLSIFLKTFLADGFFHADLHEGNFLYLRSSGQIGVIDFGLMGFLGSRSRKSFIAIIYSLINFNYENLVYEFLDVAEYGDIPDVDLLVNDIRDAINPYVGLSVGQINFSKLFKKILNVLKRYGIFLPRDWYIVFRAMITLDGVGRSLGFDTDIYKILEKNIKEILEEGFDKRELIEEAVMATRDIASLTRLLPRHFKWFLKDFSKKKHRFDFNIVDLQKSTKRLSYSISFLGHCLLAAVFILSGVILLGDGFTGAIDEIKNITWVFWSLGLLLIVKSLYSQSDS